MVTERKPKPKRINMGFVEPRRLPAQPEQPEPTLAQGLGYPQWGMEERTWDMPITLEGTTGETVDALIRPDNTVWHGKERVGQIDPKTGGFIPAPPSVGEQFGTAFAQIGMGALKGVEYFFKPFELFHEYAAVPFAMGVTAPWWSGGKPLEAETFWEFQKEWFAEEGKFREAYHDWEAPEYLRGAIEFAPWLIVPSFGAVGTTLRGLGAGGRMAAKALFPYIWTEKLAGALIKTPFRGTQAIARFVMKEGKIVGVKPPARYAVKAGKLVDEGEGAGLTMPEKLDHSGLMNEIHREYPKRVRAGTEEVCMILEAKNFEREATTYARTQSTVLADNWLGSRDKAISLLGLQRIGPHHWTSMIMNPHVKPKPQFKGASMEWPDVFANAHKYNFMGEEGKRILALAKNDQELNAMLFNWARAHGLPIKTLTHPDPETRHISQMVTGKIFGDETVLFGGRGEVIFERPTMAIKRGKTSIEMQRVFDEAEKGVKAGFIYADPVLTSQYKLAQVFYRVHRQESLDLLKTLGETPLQREVAGLRETLQYWKGAKDDLNFITKLLKQLSTMAPGERPAEQTLRKLDRIYPSLGGRVRELLAAKPVYEAAAVEIAEREMLGRELSPILQQIQGLEADMAGEPARRFIDIIAKRGMYKGEIAYITKHQYRILTGAKWVKQDGKRVLMGGREPTPGMMTPDGQKVRWEYALDTIATEQGYPSGEAFKEAIERASVVNQELQLLKAEVSKARPELKTLKGKIETLAKARKEAIKELMPVVRMPLKGAEREERVARAMLEQSKRMTGRAHYTEGRTANIPELQNYIFPDVLDETGKVVLKGTDIAHKISVLFGVDTAPKALKIAAEVTRASTSQMATFDASWWLIQGMRTLGRDNANWAKSRPSTLFANTIKEGFWNLGNPNRLVEFRRIHAPTYQRFPEIPIMSHDIMVGMGILERWIRLVPVAGNKLGDLFNQTYGRAAAMFNAAGEASRVLTIENMERKWFAEGGTRIGLVDYASMLSGTVDLTRMGVPRWEQLVGSCGLFSQFFTRAWLMSIRQMFRGTQTARAVQEDLAGMFAAMLGGYVTLSVLVGQEPKLNPAPKSLGGDGAEFLSFQIGDAVVGLPGWGYSLLRWLMAVTVAAQEKPDSLVKLDTRNPTVRFVMSRASPMVGMARELATQRDFIGKRLDEPDDWARVLLQKMTPIATQALLLEEHAGSGKFYAFGAELLGARTYPQSEWEDLKDLQDKYANDEFQKKFEDLNLEQKDQLIEKYPDYRELKEGAGEKYILESGKDWDIWLWAGRKQADANYYAGMEQGARSLIAGAIDYKTYIKQADYLKRVYQGSRYMERLISAQANPDDAKQFSEWLEEEQKPEDRALSQYWKIIGDPVTNRETGLPDWDATEVKLKQFMASLDPELSEYVLRNRDRRLNKLPPMAQKIERLRSEGRQHVEEYYNLPEGKARTQYRRANPTVDAWLFVMGRVTRPQSQTALTTALEMLRDRGIPETIVAPGTPLAPTTATPQAQPRVPWIGKMGTRKPGATSRP